MYQANLISQGQQQGMLLVSHQGELQPNSEHHFQPKGAPFSDYSLSLVVAPDACTGYPTRIVGNIEGRDIVLNIPRLQMMTPGAKAYRPQERYLLTFTSILDASTLLEFTVSLILDGNPRVERHYLGIKPDHLPEAWEPSVQGPWYHLAVWGNRRELKLPGQG